MPTDTGHDQRIVMTLDAGGTGLKFSAIRGNRLLSGPTSLPTEAVNLDRCLANIVQGFEGIKRGLPQPPVAISFAFPGPADYPSGIVNNIGNLPAFRGGVALGPMLEEKFGVPVFINNDGDLFVYGEAIAGFLPYVNRLLEDAGSPKRFHNLFGMTLGTGLGGGFVRNGELFIGDNSAAGEVWLLRNEADPSANAEEGASIRAVRRDYASACGIPAELAPEPRVIFEIGMGRGEGNRSAAVEAFRRMGEVAGDVIAQALTLVDGLAVIGGGMAGAHPLFLPALVASANSNFEGTGFRRLIPRAFNLEDAGEREIFLRGEAREIAVPGSARKVQYDPMQRTGIGISRLGTSEAVAIGAYAFALSQLDRPRC
ncbi:MAG TPA: ROK family protein [Terriglobia bacterium]|nr:ROK family protein [Terriglobia bacterium]